MNIFEFGANLTFYVYNDLYTLVPCSHSLRKSHCIEYHGSCIINKKDPTQCVCSPCFTGEHCEKELSRNVWQFGMLFSIKSGAILRINSFTECIFGVFHLFNGLLCLQTYLCKQIRQTNLGIYLIMLSIISIYMGSSHFIMSLINIYATINDLESISNVGVICHYQKYAYIPFFPMFNWFTTAVAIERVLVECSIKYGLHDSRRRSVIFSAIIIIVCFLSTLPGMFTVSNNFSSKIQSMFCLNLTPTGYIIFETIRSIHYSGFYFVSILMNIIVLIKLIRRRQRFMDNDSLFDHIVLIFRKHKDFFIPYLIQIICLLPRIIMDYIMTCSKADTMLVVYIDLVFNAFKFLPFTLLFYLYVSLSPVYLAIFWNSSPAGKFLVKMKHKLHILYENPINNNGILLKTYT